VIGYLILDRSCCPDDFVRRAISNMATFRIFRIDEIDGVRIYLFKNQEPNNYLKETPRFVLIAAGTFIYHSIRGYEALVRLAARLVQGGSVVTEYRYFHGPYTLVVVDKVLNRLYVATDREGLQYCFTHSTAGRLTLSSNQLLLAAISNSALNPAAIRQFIHIGYCLKGETLFKNIERVEAATTLTRQEGNWRSHRLWKIHVQTPSLPDTFSQIVERTSAMLERAVSVAGAVEPGRLLTELTGGTDSRTILSFLLGLQPRLTVTATGAADHIDIVRSRKIAERLNLNHFWDQLYTCPELKPPIMNEAIEIADGNINPLRLLQMLTYLKERSRRFVMVFGGNGGPLFKDHYWLFEFNRTGLAREPNWQRVANLSLVNYVIQDDFFVGFSHGILQELAGMFLEHSRNARGTNNQKLDYVYFDLKCPTFMGAWISFNNRFNDIYHPLLEADIVQYVINIDPSVRKYNILQFSMIHRNNRKLAWMLTDTGVPAVPPVGKFGVLRALFVRRYARSGFRKASTFVLKRQDRTGPRSIGPVAEELRRAGYFDLLNYDTLAIAPIVSRRRLSAMLEHPGQGSNEIYLMNTLAVELFVRRVEELRGEPIEKL
jgi:hypothetical protein